MSEGDALSKSQTERLVELAKRRGFFFPACEAYGGVSGFYTFGPEGARLKRRVESAWRERFSVREGHPEIDAPTILPEPVFEASGHLETFDDMLVECPECRDSHRADHVVEGETDIEDAEALPIPEVEEVIAEYELSCPTCGAPLAGEAVESFNLMFATTIGPGSGAPGYLRPETAQGIFVEFPRLKEYARGQLPFGITQIGRAYRNEISPRRSILRVRELTQAELELFVDPDGDDPDLDAIADVSLRLYSSTRQRDQIGPTTMSVKEAVEGNIIASPWIAYYLAIAREWFEEIGVDMDRFHFRQHLSGERSHYASDCWDAEVELDGNWIELAGFAYRGEYDLLKHDQYGDDDYTVFKQYDEPRTVERATIDPDMSELGPRYGSDATAIVERLEEVATDDPTAFDADVISVEVGDETYEIPVGLAGFSIESVTETGVNVRPHVIEPSFGIDRLVYTIMNHQYREDTVDGEERTVLSLVPAVAPTTVAVVPLMAKDGLDERARDIVATLRQTGVSVSYDETGNIGRRYRRQDEVGTPYCVTVDYETLEEDTVTIRDRDSTEQIRVPIEDLPQAIGALAAGERDIVADG